jgi:hypothetical protein
MDHRPKRTGTLALRLIVRLALLGWPRVGVTTSSSKCVRC